MGRCAGGVAQSLLRSLSQRWRVQQMLSLTYVSSAAKLLSVADLVEMLQSIRPKNEGLLLSGMLLYSGGNIIQVIEGPEGAVESVFGAIATDPRHRGVLVLLRETIQQRAFPDWSMGFRYLGRSVLSDIAGYNDFVQSPLSEGLGPQASSAYKLLEVFRENMR
jgi:hypothetical protein